MRTPHLRLLILCLFALIPVATLFHPNDLGRFDTQHSAMAGPDEFSYLLMAQQFLHGGGLSLEKTIGLDTFYPPGYPLLIAAWTKLFFDGNLTAFSAHALNAAVLSACTFPAYFLARRLLLLLSPAEHRRFTYSPEVANWLALLVAGLFATNWHVLDTSLLLMSEPPFMLVTFLWLYFALRWPAWYMQISHSLVMTLLAVIAWSMRGAGIVCVACTIGYPLLLLALQFFARRPCTVDFARRAIPIALALLIPFAYQTTLAHFSPEKSLTSVEDSANSYPRQLLHGLTEVGGGRPRLSLIEPSDYPDLLGNITKMVLQHFNVYATSFVPLARENPDMHFRDIIGKIIALFALMGWLFHTTSLLRKSSTLPPAAFIHLYVLLYMGLFLVWPFDFARFWSPLLPLMLAYCADALMRFTAAPEKMPRFLVTTIVLTLLLALCAQELTLQLANYARRLNYVSDALADATRAMVRASPDPAHTVIAGLGADEHFALAWYCSQVAPGAPFAIRSPLPHLPANARRGEHADEMLLRLLADQPPASSARLYFFNYFPGIDTRDTLSGFARDAPAGAQAVKIFQKEIVVSVWRIDPPPPPPAAAQPSLKSQ